MLNKSGYEVYADNLLVLLDGIRILETIKKNKDGSLCRTEEGHFISKANLIIPLDAVETETNQATEGFLVDMGEKAFEGLKKKPKLGQLLTFTRYAGRPIFGDDGKIYRRLNHKEINGGSTSKILTK
jgi:hypothetical protein